MSMRDVLAAMVAAVVLAGCATAPAARVSADASPGFGRPASAAELAFWDRSIEPDGANLPPGAGDAAAGKEIFALKCAACHGATGAETDAPSPALIGGIGSLATDRPLKTVGSYWPYAPIVFDYIRRAMPYTAPKSLTDDEVYALTAYLLAGNGIIEADAVLDADALAAVEMPNRDGFVSAWPPG